MSRRIVARPEAAEDVVEAAEWYEKRSAGLSAEFLRALDAVIARVARDPLHFPRVHQEMRRALLRRFPYGVIFTVSEEEIVILACAHGKQHPEQWQQRR